MPIVTVPTTLAGAELSRGGAYVDDGEKHIFVGARLPARLTVYDPAAIADVPTDVLLASGMNGLAHCMEAVYGAQRSPVTDAFAHAGTAVLVRSLLRFATGDRSPENMISLQEGAIFGGMALNAGVGVHHLVCHAVGGRLGVSHGRANAAMLPYALAFNATETSPQQGELAYLVAREMRREGVEQRSNLAQRMASLQERLGLPRSLRDLGLAAADLSAIRTSVLAEGPAPNPRPLTGPALEALLTAAWSGDLSGAASR